MLDHRAWITSSPPRALINVPTVYVRTAREAETVIDNLTCRQSTIWYPAALTAHYGPTVRQGYRFAAVIWQTNIYLYTLSVSGLLATLEAVITELPQEDRHAA